MPADIPLVFFTHFFLIRKYSQLPFKQATWYFDGGTCGLARGSLSALTASSHTLPPSLPQTHAVACSISILVLLKQLQYMCTYMCISVCACLSTSADSNLLLWSPLTHNDKNTAFLSLRLFFLPSVYLYSHLISPPAPPSPSYLLFLHSCFLPTILILLLFVSNFFSLLTFSCLFWLPHILIHQPVSFSYYPDFLNQLFTSPFNIFLLPFHFVFFFHPSFRSLTLRFSFLLSLL